MMNYEKIHLLSGEKHSLFSFHFRPRKTKNKIKYFDSLYHDFSFIKQNFSTEADSWGQFLPDGTYSISENYRRYKIYRRKQIFSSLPNWIAIVISLLGLLGNALMLLC